MGIVNRSVGLYLVLAAVLLGTTFTLTLGVDTKTKQTVFSYLGVPALPAPFNDLYGVLAWGDCIVLGEDPTKVCSVAPKPFWPMNYPQTWLVFKHLGIFIKDTAWVGVVVEIVFLLSSLCLVWRRDLAQIWPLLVLLPTQPVWLVLERGNVDLFIYPSILLLGYVSEPIAFALVFGGVTFKFYPLGAAAVFLNQKIKSIALWFALTAGASAVFFLTPYANLTTAKGNAMISQWYMMAFGWKVLGGLIDEVIAPTGIRAYPVVSVVLFILMGAICLAGCYVAWKWEYRRPDWTMVERRWLQAGLGIFLVCFAIGNNYDYRYIFLLPTLPALTAAIRQKGWRCPEGAFTALLILACWLAFPYRFPKVAAIQELTSWGLLAFAVPLVLWSRQAPEESSKTKA